MNAVSYRQNEITKFLLSFKRVTTMPQMSELPLAHYAQSKQIMCLVNLRIVYELSNNNMAEYL